MQVLVYGDCAVNVSPSAGDLANIAIASADTAAAFGVRPPRVALLSYSTGASGSGAEVEKVGLNASPHGIGTESYLQPSVAV
jgi:phosphate acetyltransferase